MNHTLKRHRLHNGHLGHRCAACGQNWMRHPSSACPGVPLYSSWDCAQADGLQTQTQWRAERRRVLADVAPQGAFPSRTDWYWLYSEAQTTPMREASLAQREVLERGRRTQRTCVQCGRTYESAALLDDRVCFDCILQAGAREVEVRNAKARAHASAWARQLLAAADWVMLDTETTGLEEAEIVEIAVVAPDGEVLLNTLVRPMAPIPPEAIAIHGVTDAMVADAPTWLEVYPQLVAIVRGNRTLAYNADFDAGMVAHTCALHGLAGVKAHWLDLMEPYADWFGAWSNAHQDYRFQPLPAGGHRALDDCLAALSLLCLMAAPDAASTSIKYLLEADVAEPLNAIDAKSLA
jgi:DNA polymerase III epsilon subunit-like protein